MINAMCNCEERSFKTSMVLFKAAKIKKLIKRGMLDSTRRIIYHSRNTEWKGDVSFFSNLKHVFSLTDFK